MTNKMTNSKTSRISTGHKSKATKKQLKKSLSQIRDELAEIIADSTTFNSVPGVHSDEVRTIFFDIGDTLLVRKNRKFVWLPAALETVEILKSNGMPLGLISNTVPSDTRQSLAAVFPAGFFDLFDDHLILLSSEVKIEKPSLGIFFHALKQAGVTAGHCLFVTENLGHTFAAQRAGMKALRVTDFDDDFLFLQTLFASV